MLDTLADIRDQVKLGVYRDEQHVRFSIVGRICAKLGWNIWNPAEFYTEYPVNKYPLKDIDTLLRGKVDVALFLADKGSETAEVFIEVKNLGKLKSDLDAAEDQLQRYNYYDRAAINILTDGNTWRFYYSLATGTFANGLFNEFYLLEDDLESIAIFLQRILSRKNFPIQAITTAGDMYREFGMIRKIQAIKGEAIKIADSIKMDEHETAQRLLKTKENAEIDLETIKRLWDRNIPICDQKAEESPSLSVPALSMDDNVIPVFMKSKGCLAKGLFNLKTRETIILKDSEAATQNAPSFSGYEFEYKSRLIEAGDLYLNKEGTKYIFSRDVRFTAPSLAASIVRSGTANGLTRWKDEKGNALKDYFAKQETQRSPTSSTLPQADTIDVSMTYKGCTVKGSFDLKTKETIIFKGSEATIKNAPSFKTGSRKKNKMIEAGDLSLNEAGTKLIFQRDVVFRAPSTAASIIKGMNTNGYTSWVDNQGRVIDHYFQNE